MINNIVLYVLKSCILFSLDVVIISLVQNTVFKRHKLYVKALWIISIIHAFLPYGLFNIQLNRRQANEIRQTVREGTQLQRPLLLVLAIIWLIGVIAVIAKEVRVHFVMKKVLRRAIYIPDDDIYISSDVDGAFIYGVFRPKIIMSYRIDLDTRNYVLRHERQHIGHGDNFLKLCYMIVMVVNWFNPLVRKGKKELDCLIELCCDGYTVQDFTKEQKEEYMKCMLEQSVCCDEEPTIACGFLHRKSEICSRIAHICGMRAAHALSYVAINLAMLVCVLALSVGIQQGENRTYVSYAEESAFIEDSENIVYPHGKNERFEVDKHVICIINVDFSGDCDTQVFYNDRGEVVANFTYIR